MSKKHSPPWTPSPAHGALLPPISGCTFNGFGEVAPRRPRQIFWLRKPGSHPFARLLDAVKQRFSSVAAYREVYANADRGPHKLPEPATTRTDDTAGNWTRRVKAFVLGNVAARPGGYPGAGSEAELLDLAASVSFGEEKNWQIYCEAHGLKVAARVDLAHRMLQVDPLDEDAVAALLRAAQASGSEAQAQRIFSDYATRLAEALGVEPSLALRNLFHAPPPATTLN